METIKPALNEIMEAARRLKPILHHTELDLSSTFSRMSGGYVYLKCENRQKTGSFKIRGATNKLSAMVERGERLLRRKPRPGRGLRGLGLRHPGHHRHAAHGPHRQDSGHGGLRREGGAGRGGL